MRLALIADTFPPFRTSGALQLRDLASELVRQGHTVTVILPSATIKSSWVLEGVDGVEVLRLRAPKSKDVGFVRRTLAECVLPFAMLWNMRKTPQSRERWDGVVWYAPTIFLGLVANYLKRTSRCHAYLIVRDIFPDWALDMGLLRPGLLHTFFRAVARYQYSVADTIGVQSPGNMAYFEDVALYPPGKVEVLQNWLGEELSNRCSIDVSQTILAGRKIFVYAGNMGVAQGMDIFLELADAMRMQGDVGFLFVGRGSEVARLAAEAKRRDLANVVFNDEIAPEEIPALYAQCHVGIVALDRRHKTHNIPGKFLTYMRSGLPVLAVVNPGNDLANLVREERVGEVLAGGSVQELEAAARDVLCTLLDDADVRGRCCAVFARMFSPATAVRQVVSALSRVRQDRDEHELALYSTSRRVEINQPPA
jgi:glycosyltransferase involved in cell wall biosynthesis